MNMTHAIASLVRRVDDTLEQAAGRFPLYAEPTTGAWTWSDDGGWFGGFWPGLLWLSAAATHGTSYARAAAGAAARLGPRTNAPTVLRGFLYWYGAGLGFELGHASRDTADLATAAARSMAADFDPVAQLLPPGDEDASEYGWPRPGACIDGLPGTIPLLAFASRQIKDPVLRSMALAHARGHQAMCIREDGSVAQSATYDQDGNVTSQSTIDGSSKGSTWSRAQAWAMLGLTQAAHLSAEFTQPATAVADWYLSHVPEDRICYWDFDDPAIPEALRDTSATAIAAAALAKLAPLAGDRYRQAAQGTLHALSTQHINAHGGLIDGCYSLPEGLATSNELIWGDYFMLETALALDGSLDLTHL
jgi:unsaturated chondroitin disaccharide hydrolase